MDQKIPDKIRLSIVLPVYSETKSLIDTIEQIRNSMPNGYLHEIILIIAPKSIPESFAICEQLVKKYSFISLSVQKNNPGVGWAICEGLEKVSGTHVLMMACDGETDPQAIPAMIKKAEETGCDIVAGSRWMQGGGFEKYGVVKRILNFFFQKMLQILFVSSIDDYTYAYRLYKSKVLKGYSWAETGFPFFLESILKPVKMGCRVEQVPVKWSSRLEGQSKNSIAQTLKYIETAFRIYFQK